MLVPRKILLSENKPGLLPAINYILGGPSSPSSAGGIPVNVNVSIDPGLKRTLYTGVGVVSGAIVFSVILNKLL